MRENYLPTIRVKCHKSGLYWLFKHLKYETPKQCFKCNLHCVVFPGGEL